MNNIETFQITEQNINQRLDMYIASLDLDLSRSMAQKMIENGQVLVNEKIPKTSYKTKLGDIIQITIENNVHHQFIITFIYIFPLLLIYYKLHPYILVRSARQRL